jgi:hypothetical protein
MFEVGQLWFSVESPHEDFVIYDVVKEMESKVWFWKRVNDQAFEDFVKIKKGYSVSELIKQGKNTYPYTWAGECSESSLRSKIKKYRMNPASK